MSLVYHKITDMDSWHRFAPPKDSENQWRCTRSAMELARYITDNLPELPNPIKEALKYAHESPDDNYVWCPEYVTALPGSGGGRNHDLILFGKDIVVGVEAKADEKFDNTLASWLKNGEKNADKGANRKYRLDCLCKIIFNKKYSEEHKELRYQLLSALSGTIIEAKKQSKAKALLMVISFNINNQCHPINIARNNRDFADFIEKIGNMNDESLSINCPEIVFAGHDIIDGIETYIVKVSIERKDLRCNRCSYYAYCTEEKRWI